MANLFRLRRASGPSAPDPEAAVGADGGATDAEGSESEPPEPEPLHGLDVTGLLAVADPVAPVRDEAERVAPSSDSDTEVAEPEADGESLEMESLLKALAPPGCRSTTPRRSPARPSRTRGGASTRAGHPDPPGRAARTSHWPRWPVRPRPGSARWWPAR